MIITATPLRISFVGGGTDFENFYRQYPGRVLTTSINKYIYITVNKKFDDKIRLSYAKTEEVDHRDQLEHNIARAALEEVKIKKGIEITSVGDVPGKGTGLGSSSSYTVGLLKSLYSHLNQHIAPDELAEKACHIEIDKIKSPIGKQDQYIAAYGGLNLITFNTNGKIDVQPVFLSPKIKEDFQNHLLLFYTDVQRSSNPILAEHRENIGKKIKILKNMSDIVPAFKDNLEKGNFKKLGELLHQNWLWKKEMSSGVSNAEIEKMYGASLKAGAWGGKILGAGGGGFLLVLAAPDAQPKIKKALANFKISSFRFTEAGSKIIFQN